MHVVVVVAVAALNQGPKLSPSVLRRFWTLCRIPPSDGVWSRIRRPHEKHELFGDLGSEGTVILAGLSC